MEKILANLKYNFPAKSPWFSFRFISVKNGCSVTCGAVSQFVTESEFVILGIGEYFFEPNHVPGSLSY